MAKKQEKAAPAPGAETAGELRAAWPFPKSAPDAKDLADMETLQHAERIRVDAVSLYTDPAKNTVERIALEQLLESPFNPRTRYDQQALEDWPKRSAAWA
jgi:hypothetical protein